MTSRMELVVQQPRFFPLGLRRTWSTAIWFLSLCGPGYGDLDDILVGDLPSPHALSRVYGSVVTSSASSCKTRRLARRRDYHLRASWISISNALTRRASKETRRSLVHPFTSADANPYVVPALRPKRNSPACSTQAGSLLSVDPYPLPGRGGQPPLADFQPYGSRCDTGGANAFLQVEKRRRMVRATLFGPPGIVCIFVRNVHGCKKQQTLPTMPCGALRVFNDGVVHNCPTHRFAMATFDEPFA